ncbi:androgen-dependent TFPI-regulating protein-like [Bufo gargarizans]|uniref:androgen-dependent TFPI-regulating protein-like n=1 Tax=Bufo gargarizans TaxID=30331 RepID=UPI001CF4EAFE|nr:androgen-dependent TFPI-regulating protein-like [Bufo gargarizans]
MYAPLLSAHVRIPEVEQGLLRLHKILHCQVLTLGSQGRSVRFVFLSFWALYSYDRQLVYPEGLDKVIPQWLNHAVHTAVFPIAVLEILTSPHRYPPKRKGLALLGICSISYISWVIWIYFADGNWVYPFLGILSPFEFFIFLLSSHILAASVYIVGETLNYVVWGEVQNIKMKM